MIERLPWFPCYPTKLLGALSGMLPHEGYVYTVVCLRIYEVGGPIADTVEVIARRTGFKKGQVEDALARLFASGKLVRVEAGIMNPFAESVLADSREHRKRLSEAGREGAKKTNEKTKVKQRKRTGEAEPSPPAPPRPGSGILTSTSTIDSPTGESKPPAAGSDWPKDYQAQFWGTYPRRTEKKAALAKLDAIKKTGKVSWAVFFGGVMRFAAKCERDRIEERYIKQPTTWLNRGCWDDEISTAPQQSDRRGGGYAEVLDLLNHGIEEDEDR